jgi:hypothetical protein
VRGVSRGVLERIGTRRLARGHRRARCRIRSARARRRRRPGSQSPRRAGWRKRPAGSPAWCSRSGSCCCWMSARSSTGLSPSSRIVGARAVGGGRRCVSVPGRPGSGTRVSAMTSVRLVIHAAAGAQPVRNQPGQERRSRQSARPVVARLLAADSERVCRLGYRRARLAISPPSSRRQRSVFNRCSPPSCCDWALVRVPLLRLCVVDSRALRTRSIAWQRRRAGRPGPGCVCRVSLPWRRGSQAVWSRWRQGVMLV